MADTKRCIKCREVKPATTEFFAKHRARQDGLQVTCKECQHVYRIANRERTSEYHRIYREANKEYISVRRRAHYVTNKERVLAAVRAYRIANIERGRTYRIANKERIAARERAYRSANKERIAARDHARHVANRESLLDKKRIWRIEHIEAERVRGQRRRAREVNAEGVHTAADIRLQFKRQKGHCYWCGVKVGNDYHVDHIVPLARGGSNWPDNLVIACPTCNISRQDKLPHEWPQGNRLI